MHIPADVPVNDFWAVTIYDTQTRSLLQTDQQFPTVGSLTEGFKQNEDGSFDAHFGDCGDVDNHLPTVEGWNYLPRIYEPKLEELQNFRLPEMKKVS